MVNCHLEQFNLFSNHNAQLTIIWLRAKQILQKQAHFILQSPWQHNLISTFLSFNHLNRQLFYNFLYHKPAETVIYMDSVALFKQLINSYKLPDSFLNCLASLCISHFVTNLLLLRNTHISKNLNIC